MTATSETGATLGKAKGIMEITPRRKSKEGIKVITAVEVAVMLVEAIEGSVKKGVVGES
jgi:hypothetical protein